MPESRLTFTTQDPFAASDRIAAHLGLHFDLRPERGESFSGVFDLHAGSVFAMFDVGYHTPVEVRARETPALLSVGLMSEGTAWVDKGDGRCAEGFDRRHVAVLDRTTTKGLKFDGASRIICFTLSIDELRRRAPVVTGEEFRAPCDGARVLPGDEGSGRHLRRTFRHLRHCLDARIKGEIGPYSVRQAEEAAFSGLADVLCRLNGAEPSPRRNAVGQRRVHLAVEIARASSEPLGVTDLAERLGVGVRALQLAFLEERGQTPHEFLKQIRLDAVRRDFVAGDGANINAVARMWGFSNPSRFRADYMARFGADAWPKGGK